MNYFRGHRKRDDLMPGATAGKKTKDVWAVFAFDDAGEGYLQGLFYTREEAQKYVALTNYHEDSFQIMPTCLYPNAELAVEDR